MDWDKKYKYTKEIRKKYRRIYDVPKKKSTSSILKFAIKDQNIKKILEIGAGSNTRKKEFSSLLPNAVYKTMDIDTSTKQDFYNINEITEKFDLVIGLELIEHIEKNNFEKFCGQISNLVDKNGSLILSTPNIFHPNRYFKDYTHNIALCYDELASVFMTFGFKSCFPFRCYRDSFLRRIAREYLFSWLYRLLEIDYAKQIMVVFRKE